MSGMRHDEAPSAFTLSLLRQYAVAKRRGYNQAVRRIRDLAPYSRDPQQVRRPGGPAGDPRPGHAWKERTVSDAICNECKKKPGRPHYWWCGVGELERVREQLAIRRADLTLLTWWAKRKGERAHG